MTCCSGASRRICDQTQLGSIDNAEICHCPVAVRLFAPEYQALIGNDNLFQVADFFLDLGQRCRLGHSVDRENLATQWIDSNSHGRRRSRIALCLLVCRNASLHLNRLATSRGCHRERNLQSSTVALPWRFTALRLQRKMQFPSLGCRFCGTRPPSPPAGSSPGGGREHEYSCQCRASACRPRRPAQSAAGRLVTTGTVPSSTAKQ